MFNKFEGSAMPRKPTDLVISFPTQVHREDPTDLKVIPETRKVQMRQQVQRRFCNNKDSTDRPSQM